MVLLNVAKKPTHSAAYDVHCPNCRTSTWTGSLVASFETTSLILDCCHCRRRLMFAVDLGKPDFERGRPDSR
jgi:hypothetical protein